MARAYVFFSYQVMASHRLRSTRRLQPATRHGAGVQHLSPIKPRDTRKKKLVVKSASHFQRAAAQARLSKLLGIDSSHGETSTNHERTSDPPQDDDDAEMTTWVDENADEGESAPASLPAAV